MTQITLLPLDLTGKQLTNRVLDEQHTLITIPNRSHRVIMPRRGAFYSRSEQQRLIDGVTGRSLTPGVDYVATYLYSELTAVTGQEVCGILVVTNPAVSAKVTLSYQAVGGWYSLSSEDIAVVMDALKAENQAVTWAGIAGKPYEYTPAPHHHKFWQLYGLESVNHQMERLKRAAFTKDTAAVAHEEDYGDVLFDEAEDTLEVLTAGITAHINNYNNPHGVTKVQVGLGNLFNYYLAETEHAIDPAVTNRYMTVKGTGEALQLTAIPALHAHLTDYDDPHEVTAEQIGAYTTAVMDTTIDGLLPLDGTAVDSMLFQGRTYQQVYDAIRSGLKASLVTHDVFDPERLGTGAVGASKLLLGNKTWGDIRAIFDTYEKTNNKVLYIGMQSSRATALNNINVTYSNISAYPVGTVVLYAISVSAHLSVYNQVYGAVRQSGGWVNI
jgi:hypothetical protein